GAGERRGNENPKGRSRAADARRGGEREEHGETRPRPRSRHCVRKRDPEEKKRKPESVGNVLGAFLKDSKLEERVEAAQVVPEWESLVGKQIATVTKPISVTPDGVLFVAVKTNGWMTELSLMEPQILRALNAKAGRVRVRKLRLQLMR